MHVGILVTEQVWTVNITIKSRNGSMGMMQNILYFSLYSWRLC